MKKDDWIEYETIGRPGKTMRARIINIWPGINSAFLDLCNVRNWSLKLENLLKMRVLRRDELTPEERELD